MVVNEALTETLNDLIRINNDRIEGYKRADAELKGSDVDLRATFSKMADESRTYVNELERAVTEHGGEVATDTTVSGKIYRAWMDVKKVFSANDRKAILESCEFGEDAAQKAYETALGSDAEIEADVRKLIVKQKDSLKDSHDIIKRYRDAQ
jgi:uncharacterized protein (TIGR02284 family)